MSAIGKVRMMDQYEVMTPVALSAQVTAHFWVNQERQRPKQPAPFWLLAVIGHLIIAALFLITLKEPAPIPDDIAIELVTLPAPPQVKPPEPKPQVKEAPKPRPVQQRTLPKPIPHIDPPSPAAIAASPPPPSQPQAAPAPEAPPTPQVPQAAPTPYLAELFAHIDRYKRYPRALQLAHVEGTVYLRFTLNRQGKLLSSSIDRSSGHQALDNEVLAAIERAQPLPIPPADMPDQVEFIIPIRFLVR